MASQKLLNQEKTSVFVSGLAYTCTEEEIREFFADCGEIKSLFLLIFPQIPRFFRFFHIRNIKLPTYQDTGRLLGYCHITFESAEMAENVLFSKKNS